MCVTRIRPYISKFIRYKREVAPCNMRIEDVRGSGGIERWKDIERDEGDGEFNKYWSLGDVSPQVSFIAEREKGRESFEFNLSKCLYFFLDISTRPSVKSFAVFLTPLSSREMSWEWHPHPFAFQYFPRCATDTSVWASLLPFMLAHSGFVHFLCVGITRTRSSSALPATLQCVPIFDVLMLTASWVSRHENTVVIMHVCRDSMS